jgi:glycosyltransferase involved in cell wall biosynthesis
MCTREAARQNDLHMIPGLSIVPGDQAYGFDLLIKPGQPFASAALRDHAARALKIAYYMLDTIVWDCLYLWSEDTDMCWNLAGDGADALLFISPFGYEQFRRRFRISPNVLTVVTPLSLDVGDYIPSVEAATPEAGRRDILVFGNSFFHKFVRPAVACLTAHFPEIRIVLFGMEEWTAAANVVAIPSGPLSQDELEKIFASALCLVYPSTYEGFGLPIMEGLARRIPVIARDSELNRWIASRTNGAENLHLFQTLEDLVAKISEVLDAPPGNSRIASETPPPAPAWDEVMDGLWQALTRLARSDNLTQFHHRKELLRLPPPPPEPPAPPAPPAPPPPPDPEPPAPPPPPVIVLKSERVKRPATVRLARELRRALQRCGLLKATPSSHYAAPQAEEMPPQ